VVRPLVANIARDGRAQRRGKGFRVARYTEDIGVMAKSLPAIEPACPVVPAFLTEQGLALHPEKTRIVPRTAGFDVLGFHGQMRGQKRLITPPNQKGQALLQASRAWLKTHATATAAGVMHHRTPRLRGGALYYRHVVSKHTVQQVDYHIGRALGRGVKRRHPPKPKRWLYRRDVEVGKYGATFSTASRERRGQTRRLRRERRPTLPIVCHVQVKGRAPPDEPSLNADGESRRLKRGRQRVAKGSLLYGIAEAPRWPCPGGGQALFDGQEVHLPHRLPVKAGGRDDRQHRHGLHAPCHRPRHRPGVTAGHSA
jgi:RNA-directed DNA polymerase